MSPSTAMPDGPSIPLHHLPIAKGHGNPNLCDKNRVPENACGSAWDSFGFVDILVSPEAIDRSLADS